LRRGAGDVNGSIVPRQIDLTGKRDQPTIAP
jgi:hypothetical protein